MVDVPIFWITGSVGAGKSAAAWALHRRLADSVRTAYVDIDQLGMLYPESDTDPDGHLLKTDALNALLPGYAAHGAQLVIVSGVVDPSRGPREALPAASDVTVVVLNADTGDLRTRILARGCSDREADESVAENERLRVATFPDLVIDTAELTVAETVDRLLPAVHVREAPAGDPGRLRGSSASTSVIAVTGPRAVGSSTVGYGLASRRWRAGERTAFLDPEQLSFVSGIGGPERSDLLTRQLAAMHELTASRGARLVVISGRPAAVNADGLCAAAPEAPHLVVRLRADAATIERNVRQRALGNEARLADDDLLDADEVYQAEVVVTALAEQRLLDETGSSTEYLVEVTGRSVDELVAELVGLTTGY